MSNHLVLIGKMDMIIILLCVKSYDEIFNKGQNVIIDSTYLAKWAHDELVAGVISKGWGQYVRFYP
ncbi:hypothetical protein [Acetivibrio cellulolyticus]|uniref:hypothetical protein n=1 Tax=Acetivibrio cellulolyticus TaxID=35830 RepID=UPI0001E2E6B5|nr:hypothetical protein [Acetivibrio cellulolyticus]